MARRYTVSDLRPGGRGCESRSGRYQVVSTRMADCRLRTRKPSRYSQPPSMGQVNSAFHPSGVARSSSGLSEFLMKRYRLIKVFFSCDSGHNNTGQSDHIVYFLTLLFINCPPVEIGHGYLSSEAKHQNWRSSIQSKVRTFCRLRVYSLQWRRGRGWGAFHLPHLNFGLSENCRNIFLLSETFCPKLQNFG